MDTDEDLALALQLQAEMDDEESVVAMPSVRPSSSSVEKGTLSPVDPSWELLDPNPDIRALFLQFNDQFFWGRLAGIEVRWSPRMTLCAGLCVYEGRGGLCSVRLSSPLLKLRPRKDLVETLLHEMIHAYLFVTDNNKDHDGHGPEFHKHMYRINKETGANISVYHTFHDEVNNYRQHWWRCTGPCRERRPFFGYVKRAINRAPSERDLWWKDHKNSCNGTFEKIKEPDNYGKKKTSEKSGNTENTKSDKIKEGKKNMDIRLFVGKGNVLGQGKNLPGADGDTRAPLSSPKKPTSTVTSEIRTKPSATVTNGNISKETTAVKKPTLDLNKTGGKIPVIKKNDGSKRNNNNSESIRGNMGSESSVLIIDSDDDIDENKSFEPASTHTSSIQGARDISSTDALSVVGSSNKGTAVCGGLHGRTSNNHVADKVRAVWADRFKSMSHDKGLPPLSRPKKRPPTHFNTVSNGSKKAKTDATNHGAIENIFNRMKSKTSDTCNESISPMKSQTPLESEIVTSHRSDDQILHDCPVCNKPIVASKINQHLDMCLGT